MSIQPSIDTRLVRCPNYGFGACHFDQREKSIFVILNSFQDLIFYLVSFNSLLGKRRSIASERAIGRNVLIAIPFVTQNICNVSEIRVDLVLKPVHPACPAYLVGRAVAGRPEP
jgi:hypothetical protein